jgi:hypothetical protein
LSVHSFKPERTVNPISWLEILAIIEVSEEFAGSKNFFFYVFCHHFLKVHLHNFLKIKEGSGSGSIIGLMGPDPGGLKTYGSGSATLILAQN